MTFIDDKIRFTHVYLLRRKSDAFQAYKDFEKLHAGPNGVGTLRSDNGGEYSSNEFKAYLTTNGTGVERTTPYTPEQNGVAERYNRTIHEMANSMMIASGAPISLWGESIMTAAYIRNRSPTHALDGMTPLEALTGEKPDISHEGVWM
jgi:transposase InsO family protein